MSHNASRASIVAKVDYLRAHPELLALDNQAMVRELRKAGLVSPNTYWRDVSPAWLRQQAALEMKE